MAQLSMGRRVLATVCVTLAVILTAVWLSPAVRVSRSGMPRAGEVRYIHVLDRNTGRSFTVRDMEQIETILRYLPGGRQAAACMPGNGFLLEFVCGGGRGVMRYVLNASLPSRDMGKSRYCEAYLRYLST